MPFLIFAIIISMIVAVLAIQNAMTVPLNFIFWEFSASLVLVILGAFLVGILAGAIFMLVMKAKHYLQNKKHAQEIENLQKEKQKLEEQIAMLQHLQMLHNQDLDADKNAEAAQTAAGKEA